MKEHANSQREVAGLLFKCTFPVDPHTQLAALSQFVQLPDWFKMSLHSSQALIVPLLAFSFCDEPTYNFIS